MADNIPIEELYSQPVVQQLLKKLDDNKVDLENIKIPYVIKNKVLMSPGVWNEFYYSASAIEDAFLKSRWDAKETRSLFLDHLDGTSESRMGSMTWVGEIANPRWEGEHLIGDLVIVDKSTAQKLAYGAKMGISPKVHGMEEGNEMLSFEFDNFSVVINPAVKTAYINNSAKEPGIPKKDGTGPRGGTPACPVKPKPDDDEKEAEKKEPQRDVKYADPGYRNDKKRYPIDTKERVRAAWSYINQPKNAEFYSADQLKSIKSKIAAAAKKFGIEIAQKNMEVSTMTETKLEEEVKEEVPKEEVKEEAKEEVKEAPVEAPAPEPVAAAVEPAPEPAPEPVAEPVKEAPKEMLEQEMSEMSENDVVNQIIKLAGILKIRMENSEEAPKEVPKAEAPKEEVKASETETKMQDTIKELSEKLDMVTAKLNEPAAKKSVKSAELSAINSDEALVAKNLDGAMLAEFMKMGGI